MSTITLDSDDEEIIEIFIEEAGEVLHEIDHHLKTLKGRPRDQNALRELRRGFHTLKGSGRMAKALDLGELAWRIENLLNRAIEGKVQVGDPLLELVATVHGLMPNLVDAFKRRRPTGMQEELDVLMGQADALASGQTPAPVAAARRQAPAAAGDQANVLSQIKELQRLFDQSARRSDEALQRAEMAFQQARRFANQIDTLAAEAHSQRGGGDVKPLLERINVLTRDIQELRELSKGAHHEGAPAPQARDVQHLIDQRVRERIGPIERSKQEMDRRMEETLQTALSAKRLGFWAMTLALIVGAGAAGMALYLMP